MQNKIQRRRTPRTILCPIFALLFLLQPTIAITAAATACPPIESTQSTPATNTNPQPAAPKAHPLKILTLISNLAVVEEARLIALRADLTLKMVALDYEPLAAANLVAQLTPEDLEVLNTHTKMLQPAGAASSTMFLAILIVVGIIVALSIGGSGHISVN